MRDPVFCGDGHTYERDAISVWLMTKDTSPKTGCVLESKALIPNFALRSAIDDLRNRRRLADEVADEDDAKTLPASPGATFTSVFVGIAVHRVLRRLSSFLSRRCGCRRY